MRLSSVLIALAFAGVASGSAWAATVISDQGHVLLNRGDGYRLVTQPTEASPGHLVIVNPGGAGRVMYPDGCIADVRPGAVYSVAQTSPCQAAASASHVETGGTITPPAPEVKPDGVSLTPLLIGGAAIGVGVGLLVSQGGKDKSASP